MNNRKSILYILLTALGLILLYNFMLAPYITKYNSGMGMGMHSKMYTSSSYFVDVRFILLIGVVIAGLLLYELLKPQKKSMRCSRCQKEIESERWKVCPICGNSLEGRKG